MSVRWSIVYYNYKQRAPKGYLKRYNPWARRITTVSTDMPHDKRHYGPLNPTKAERRQFVYRPRVPDRPGARKEQNRRFQINESGRNSKRGNRRVVIR